MAAQRRAFGRDPGLTFRMFLVMFLLALVYLAFLTILTALGFNWIFIAIIAALMLGFQYFFSDRLVLISMGAKLVSPAQEPKLHGMVERLAAQAGIPKPRIAVANTHVPNAFATGRSPRAAVVCVTTGLANRLADGEIEAVLAHELTHVKNRDVMVITLASFFATLAAFLMHSLMWMGLFGGFGGHGGRRNQGAAAIMLVYLVTVVVWIVSQLLILALSRYREYAADLGGSVLTGSPSKLASALMKISGSIARIPSEDLRKVEGANAFFIVPALKGDSLVALFSTHPPVEKRIERLRRLERQLEGL